MRAKYADDPIDEDGQESIYYLQALTDVHFTKGVNFDIAPNADAQALYTFLLTDENNVIIERLATTAILNLLHR